MSRGAAGFTLFFLVFTAVLGGISLLTHNIIYILLPAFGFTIGLLKKGRKVNFVIHRVLWIFSIGAIGYLFLWFLGNFLAIFAMIGGFTLNLELEYGVLPGTYFGIWFVKDLLPILLLVATGFFVAILFPNEKTKILID